MWGGWCGEKNGGVNLHFSKSFSPEYPSGKEQGSFLVCSHQSILGRGTGEFSHQSIFSGENGGYFYFWSPFLMGSGYSLWGITWSCVRGIWQVPFYLTRVSFGRRKGEFSHQSILQRRTGEFFGILSPEYLSEGEREKKLKTFIYFYIILFFSYFWYFPTKCCKISDHNAIGNHLIFWNSFRLLNFRPK